MVNFVVFFEQQLRLLQMLLWLALRIFCASVDMVLIMVLMLSELLLAVIFYRLKGVWEFVRISAS